MDWANRISDPATRDSFLSGAVSGLAQNSPEEAAAFVSKLPAGKGQESAAMSVVSQWAQSDPKSAAAWVGQFPPGGTRDSAIQNLVSNWSSNDPKAAGEWLASLPASKGQDRAMQSFVSQISWQFPEIAAPFADKLSDPNQRNSMVENLARQWLRMDRQSAETWLAQTSLPDDRKQQLLKTH